MKGRRLEKVGEKNVKEGKDEGGEDCRGYM